MTRPQRSFATVLVLVVVALATILIAAVQTTAFTEAMTGREALARVRAHWAARAGVEAALARLEAITLEPNASDARAELFDMEEVAEATFNDSAYRVSHTEEGKEILGPADAHAKININLMTQPQLMTLTFMTEDVADSILDWIDGDDDTNPLGAEVGFYSSLPYSYEPRNAPFRSIEELELVAGVYPDFVRGEDTNLNGLLDPEEDDGQASGTSDNADGVLDGGWSAILTTASVDDILAPGGQPRLDLRTASEGDVAQRAGLDTTQARTIVEYTAGAQNPRMQDFISNSNNLRRLAQRTPGASQDQINNAGDPLTNEQLGKLLSECGIDVPTAAEGQAALPPAPGKLNINTCPAEVLQYLFDINQTAIADAILFERDSRGMGFSSIVDLLDIPSISRQRLAQLYPILTVRSNVYIVTCRGRDLRTGIEVEMIATLDRSTLPVVIKDLRVR